jgi:hypothetical protein
MPWLASRSCSTPGCRNACKGGRCNECARSVRGSTTERGYDSDHRRLRVLAFQRDGWKCLDCGWRPQIIVECEEYGIDEPPLEVILDALRQAYSRGGRHLHGDHITPIERRPDLRLDLGNYATRCDACHNVKTRREGGFTLPAANVITVVCGPPGAGKTTYVNDHRAPGDLIWDFDSVMQAITGMQIHRTPGYAVGYAVAMREAFYLEAKRPLGHRVWIIEACPTTAERERFERDFRARVVLLDTPENVCIERVRDRGPEWPEIVAKWFRASAGPGQADALGTPRRSPWG